MTFEFLDSLSQSSNLKPILISGLELVHYNNKKYLLLEKDNIHTLYEWRYPTHVSPFQEAIWIDGLLAVGSEAHFYLFDTYTNQNISVLEMNGYFGHLYSHNHCFYVSDAIGLYCINKAGEMVWKNLELGIDGVVIHDWTDQYIFGSGELDPPNGWKDFCLNKTNGNKI